MMENNYTKEYRNDHTTNENIGDAIPWVQYGFMAKKDFEFFGFDNGKLVFNYEELTEEQTKKVYEEMKKYYEFEY